MADGLDRAVQRVIRGDIFFTEEGFTVGRFKPCPVCGMLMFSSGAEHICNEPPNYTGIGVIKDSEKKSNFSLLEQTLRAWMRVMDKAYKRDIERKIFGNQCPQCGKATSELCPGCGRCAGCCG